jgi:hypothetical protein
MILKTRTESDELMALRSLNTRMELTEKEKIHYLNLEKGYEGEVKFDQHAECLLEERYILNDLLFEVNNSYFQIDSLIISQRVIHLLDIKNFQGDYLYKLDNFYSMTTQREYKNPIDQLKRSRTLFHQLLKALKQNFLIEAYVIFINPEFTLYQSPCDKPIIYPTQVNRFLVELNHTPSKLNDGHKKLAQNLISLHHPKNPFTVLPKYNYDRLQKGNHCKICKSFFVTEKNGFFVCETCGEHEEIETAILRNVKEFQLLFPDRKITTQGIYDWCKVDLHPRTVSRILKRNFSSFGKTSDTYYQ